MLVHVWATVVYTGIPTRRHTRLLRGRYARYIRSECREFALSVCDENGRKHTTGFVIVPVKFYVLVKWNKLYDHKKLWC